MGMQSLSELAFYLQPPKMSLIHAANGVINKHT